MAFYLLYIYRVWQANFLFYMAFRIQKRKLAAAPCSFKRRLTLIVILHSSIQSANINDMKRLPIELLINNIIFIALRPFLLDLGSSFNFLVLYKIGRIPLAGDQPVARPLLTHRTTQTRN
jgi:hypothetical protein